MTEQTVRIGGRRLRLSNLDKVLYPETGTTKGEVIDYYSRIAPLLLPHIADRPLTRKRWPDGVGTTTAPGEPFFAKALEPGAPAWVRRFPIDHSSGAKDYPVVDDLPSLVYLAQVASLELHVPQWRFSSEGARHNPDRLVLDLDPGPGVGLAECAEVARWARVILRDMGLDPLPVTSGSKGIHLYARLDGRSSSEAASAVAKELARAIEADHPDLVVSQMAKAARPGKVFIDWSQNNGSKTTIAPYSLRGRPQPFVAAPRTWAELDDPGLRHLLFTEVLARPDDPLASVDEVHGPLRAYIAKRSAGRTPEPVPDSPHGDPGTGDLSRFVIQEHHASRLHWDLRLERDGVLVSWAVPKGVPPTTAKNSLAVMTEDHPLPYLDFAGEIPRGEYGAGTMTVWDSGTYELEKWRDDEVIATLSGREGGPLGRVRIALIRTEGRGEKSQWLLHRMKTDADGRPQTDGEPVVAQDHGQPASATSSAPPLAPTPAELRPMLATAATPGIARAAAARWGGTPWVEMKWDGIRGLGIWDGRRLRLRSRNGNDLTAAYPDLTAVALGLGSEPAVFDGEIVALDDTGRPSFPLLQKRMNLAQPREIEREAARTPVHLYLFDVLWVGGRDVASLPLAERRRVLEDLTAACEPPVVVPPVFDDVDAAVSTSGRFGLEGVVVKDPSSTYRRGVRSESWLKVKHSRMQEVVIGGIRPGKGNRAGTIGSLLVGVPSADGLRYAGRVGSGFGEKTLARLGELLEPLRADSDPFVGVPAADARDALWVRPELVGEVEFAEFTPGGILRQARWRGLRPDKDPGEVMRED
ncbi:ATP-dependent DNA ligase [Microbacterium sp. BWR-S6Y]|uniref:ATP-dependent DNA ligase n=1 Tax=Microbacterium sp. BWR-S6Y TaxID=3232073 RepID=UPI00352952B6